MRVVGIVAPFAPRVCVLGENSFYRATGCKRVQNTCAGCPQQQYFQGRGLAGIVEGSCGYRARGVSVQGNFVLSRNLGYKTRGSPSG